VCASGYAAQPGICASSVAPSVEFSLSPNVRRLACGQTGHTVPYVDAPKRQDAEAPTRGPKASSASPPPHSGSVIPGEAEARITTRFAAARVSSGFAALCLSQQFAGAPVSFLDPAEKFLVRSPTCLASAARGSRPRRAVREDRRGDAFANHPHAPHPGPTMARGRRRGGDALRRRN
jgi:hypothetical protein